MPTIADPPIRVNPAAALLRFWDKTEDRPDLRRALADIHADDIETRFKARALLELDDHGRQVLAVLGVRPPAPPREVP